MTEYYLEIEHAQIFKKSQKVGGDVFLSRRNPKDGRVVTVLSDGLGSGIKANVLATLTTSMAAGCIAGSVSIERTAEVIMQSLPVCSERKISYATFTILDIDHQGETRVIEYDNPPFILIRNNEIVDVPKQSIPVKGTLNRNTLYASAFRLMIGDRIIVFSDGVPQSGIGNRGLPLGWENEGVEAWVREKLEDKPEMSARELARSIVNRSLQNDIYSARDDITCAVIYARHPRQLLLVTGPPINPDTDAYIAERVRKFNGKIIVCGGTTANIISRELEREIVTDLDSLDYDLPPTAEMDGIDLVTEGIFTLGRVAELFESGEYRNPGKKNGATGIIELILNSDSIHFLVGTKINEAHQDPNVPVGLEIRRNIVKRIADVLSEKLLKEVEVNYL